MYQNSYKIISLFYDTLVLTFQLILVIEWKLSLNIGVPFLYSLWLLPEYWSSASIYSNLTSIWITSLLFKLYRLFFHIRAFPLRRSLMHNTVRYSFLVFVLLLIPIPLFAENILEPEYMEVTEHQLTCEPQQDVDFHIFRVCRNKAMTRDCTQAIYKAKENGAMSIPSNNRCIYRVKKGNSYKLYY